VGLAHWMFGGASSGYTARCDADLHVREAPASVCTLSLSRCESPTDCGQFVARVDFGGVIEALLHTGFSDLGAFSIPRPDVSQISATLQSDMERTSS
jgi:hypothetical protein